MTTIAAAARQRIRDRECRWRRITFRRRERFVTATEVNDPRTDDVTLDYLIRVEGAASSPRQRTVRKGSAPSVDLQYSAAGAGDARAAESGRRALARS